jgi:hypothetical protein
MLTPGFAGAGADAAAGLLGLSGLSASAAKATAEQDNISASAGIRNMAVTRLEALGL